MIKDIYNGEIISCWKDEDIVYLSFPWCTVNFPIEEVDRIFEELKRLRRVISRKKVNSKPIKKTGVLDEEGKPFWEKEVDKILEDKKVDGDNENFVERGIGLCMDYLEKDRKELVPSEKCQETFNHLFSLFLSEERMVEALLSAFQLGQVYQRHREEFESSKL